MLERGTCLLLDIDRNDRSRQTGYSSYGILHFGRHTRDPSGRWKDTVRDGQYSNRGDDQETWMTRRGSDEAVSRPVPWQLRANHRAERNAFVINGVSVFRSALDDTKCGGIEDQTATSSKDTYRVSFRRK